MREFRKELFRKGEHVIVQTLVRTDRGPWKMTGFDRLFCTMNQAIEKIERDAEADGWTLRNAIGNFVVGWKN